MALLKSDSTRAQQISANDLKRSWVHSVYKHIGHIIVSNDTVLNVMYEENGNYIMSSSSEKSL